MKHFSIFKATLALLLLLVTTFAFSESVTYTVVKDNNQKYIMKPTSGVKPAYSYVEFNNEFGNVFGNRYNQIAKDKIAELYLVGWEGCTIKNITFNMCSNSKSGGASLKISAENTVSAESTVLFNMGGKQFDSADWYGSWVGFQTYIFVDITKEMTTAYEIQSEEVVSVILKGSESSVYINSYTIEYEPGLTETESALGYKYERLANKAKVVDGDDVLIYYKGVAACDIFANENSAYMDVSQIADILNVYEPELMYFKVRKNGDYWRLVNQYEDTLGAIAKTKLAWNTGGMDWTITSTFDGAVIANTNTNYGTLRFNQPAESWARFTNYTSTTLPLPYIYKRVNQNPEIVATSITIPATLALPLCKDTAILQPTFLPKTTSNQRRIWESADESVATVRDGIVRPVGVGQTDITVYSIDRSVSSTCHVTVSECMTPVTGVTLDVTNLILNVCDNTMAILTATVMPEDASVKEVTWVSSNEAVATVADGVVRVVGAGQTTVTVTTSDLGWIAACNVTVEDCGSAIDHVTIAGVYTNSGKIIIEQNMPVDVTIHNVLGQLVTTSSNVQNAEFNVQQGIYTVRIGSTVMKVVVK